MQLLRYLIGYYEGQKFKTITSHNVNLPNAIQYARAAVVSERKGMLWEEWKDNDGNIIKKENKRKK